MPPAWFLFDVSVLAHQTAAPYHWPALRSVTPVVLATPTAAAREVRCADVLTTFAGSVIVAHSKGQNRRPGTDGLASTHKVDQNLLLTLVYDLCNSLQQLGEVRDPGRLALQLLRGEVLGLAVADLAPQVYDNVCARVSDDPAFLGGFWLDLGNPLQARLLAGLSAQGWISGTELILDRFDSDDPLGAGEPGAHGWWEGVGFERVRYARTNESLPTFPQVAPSLRGEHTAAVLAALTGATHFDRLGNALFSSEAVSDAPFEVSRTAMPGASAAIVEEKKLRGYVLNPDHPEGQHKARLFSDLLAIGAEDWQFLAGQLKHGLATAQDLWKVRTTEHGVRYHVVIDILGQNGVRKPVQAAWEVKPGEAPRLVTAYIASANETPSADGGLAPMVAAELQGDDRWQRLWDLARQAAMHALESRIPTPMLVDGQWYSGGRFGYASLSISLVGKTRAFAEWLAAEGHAVREGQVVRLDAPATGFDHAVAYVTAFNEVLALNGVEATTRSALD